MYSVESCKDEECMIYMCINMFMGALMAGSRCHVDADERPLPACLARLELRVPPAASKTMSIDNKQQRTDTARCQ